MFVKLVNNTCFDLWSVKSSRSCCYLMVLNWMRDLKVLTSSGWSQWVVSVPWLKIISINLCTITIVIVLIKIKNENWLDLFFYPHDIVKSTDDLTSFYSLDIVRHSIVRDCSSPGSSHCHREKVLLTNVMMMMIVMIYNWPFYPNVFLLLQVVGKRVSHHYYHCQNCHQTYCLGGSEWKTKMFGNAPAHLWIFPPVPIIAKPAYWSGTHKVWQNFSKTWIVLPHV